MNGVSVVGFVPTLRFQYEVDGMTLSLKGLYREQRQAELWAGNFKAANVEVAAFPVESPKGTLWGVATRRRVPPAPSALPRKTADKFWAAARHADLIFRAIEKESLDQGRQFIWYKELELDRFRGAIVNLDWDASIELVAAGLLSKSILAHPFPNGNHRTAMVLASTFMQSQGIRWPAVSIFAPRARDWMYGRAYSFFMESKFILQLRQRRPLFRVAHEHGFTRFHLGEDRNIRLTAGQISASDKDLAQAHLESARSLIQRLTQRDLRRKLRSPAEDAVNRWLAYLDAANPEGRQIP